MIENCIRFEKYSPKVIEDVILPSKFKNRLLECVKNQKLPNFGFWSAKPGLGKTSTARALIKSLDADAMFLNASLEKGIDVLRTKIFNFASQESFDDRTKIVVLDECDNLGKDFQQAARGFLDEFSCNCSFIFTGNYKSKIIEPLLDRLENYDFCDFDKTEMIKPIFDRLIYILESEKVEVTNETKISLANMIKFYFPCIRSMVRDLQKCVSNGNFEFRQEYSDFGDIFETLKQKKYLDVVKKVNTLNNPDGMFEFLYNNIEDFKNIPNAIIKLADYQFKAETVRDKNLNLSACLVELMGCL